MTGCDHKFVDSGHCLKCGISEVQLMRAERGQLLAEIDRLQKRRLAGVPLPTVERLNDLGNLLVRYRQALDAGRTPDALGIEDLALLAMGVGSLTATALLRGGS